jgi:8-oxo-dGTP pyrophosphatase MutT (NUDIX family)
VTDGHHRLLVFDHVGIPEAGTQVPGGGIKHGESPEAAVLRELREESGLDEVRLVRKLGESWHVSPEGQVPAGLEEQVHHAFHLVAEPVREAWEWDECDGGTDVKWRFAFRWLGLDTAAAELFPAQAMWLPSLTCSLEHV